MLDLEAFCTRLGIQHGLPCDAHNQPAMDQDGEELSASFSPVDIVVGDNGDTLGPGSLYVTTRYCL